MSIVEKALKKLGKPQPDFPRDVPARGGSGPQAGAENRAAEAGVENRAAEAPVDFARREQEERRVRPLVNVDSEALRAAGILPPKHQARKLADEYRRIKWPLLANAFGKGAMPVERGNLIMISSAIPGEGKTFTSINLARSIALERDCTVLLVDTDVARRDLTRKFGVDGEPGLVDLLLSDRLELSDILLPTDVPGFRILSAGRSHPQAPELLASADMRDVVGEMGTRYADRIVLFDTAPLLATNEAQVLASMVGQILLVVRADSTPQPAVKEAISMLDPTKAINLVLNQNRPFFGKAYYGGYYGYEVE